MTNSQRLTILKTWSMLLCLLWGTLAFAQGVVVKRLPIESPQRVLFVGNSYMYYNDSLHNHVKRLASAADASMEKTLKYKSATIGGAPLWHHNIVHLTTPGNLGIKEPFELVIMQGNSTDALSDKTRAKFREIAIEFSGVITQRGTSVALYMTPAHLAPSKSASPQMMGQVRDMYVSVGNEIKALVIPVGLAFEEAYRQRPSIKLHQDYDGSHPTLIGTYLAACTVYASVYGKSPVGNSYDYFGKISQDDAAFLQKIAQETVQKFYANY